MYYHNHVKDSSYTIHFKVIIKTFHLSLASCVQPFIFETGSASVTFSTQNYIHCLYALRLRGGKQNASTSQRRSGGSDGRFTHFKYAVFALLDILSLKNYDSPIFGGRGIMAVPVSRYLNSPNPITIMQKNSHR